MAVIILAAANIFDEEEEERRLIMREMSLYTKNLRDKSNPFNVDTEYFRKHYR